MRKSGIYQIKNLVNNKIYIGSATIISKRKREHFSNLKLNIHHNKHLQSSYNKYNLESFSFEVIEYCKATDLIKREQYWINLLNPEYNKRVDASNNTGVKRPDVVKRNKERASLGLGSGENHPMFGKKHSQDSRKQMSNAHKGKKSIRRKIILQLDESGNLIKEWSSITEAAEFIETATTNICKALKGKYKKCKGFIWKYKINT